jgi:PKD repeat protein
MRTKEPISFLKIIWSLLILTISSKAYSQDLLTSRQPNPQSYIFSNEVVLQWNRSFLETTQTSYSYILATDTNLVNIVSQANSLNQRSDTLSNLSDGKYYWQVLLRENNQTIAVSNVQSFTKVDILNHTSYSHFYISDSGLITDSNGRLSKWLNLADTAKSIAQADSNFRPIINATSSLNAMPTVDFDGLNDLMIDSSSVLLGDLFVVANWNGASSFPNFNGLVSGSSSYFVIVANGAGGNQTTFLNSSPTFRINQQNTLDFSPLNTFKLINAFRPSALNVPDFQIARDRANAGRYWNGEVASVILTSNGLSSSDRKVVNQYLCQKFEKELEIGEDLFSNYGFCDSLISVDTSFASYVWSSSSADTTSQLLLEMGKEYRLTVTTAFGCEYVDEVKYQEIFFSPSDQIICPGDTFIWDLGLSHNGYSFQWSDNSTDSLLRISQEGDYFVVVSDSNNCSLRSDTINVQIDSSLFQYDLGPDSSVCRGNVIELKNFDASITQILWSTGNTNPVQIIDTAGQYTISFSNGFCQRSDTINVSIQGLAPTADFSFADLCFSDSVSFSDASSAPIGDSLISYSWDFAGLASDTNQNAFYTFPDTGNFMVELKVTTDKGCEDISSRIVDIKPLPIVDFSVIGDCSRKPLQFSNNSSISEGSLQAFNWKFGDGSQSNLQSPSYTYSNSGNYQLKLQVTSDQNCVDSMSRMVRVNPTPQLDYQLIGSCLGDSSKLLGLADLDSGSIAAYTWFVNQQVIEDSIANILFLSSGDKTVIFRAESDSGCVEILRDTIEIVNTPIANFFAPDPCEGDSLIVIDSSLAQGDSIRSYFYELSGNQIMLSSTQRNPSFVLNELGDYQLKQIVESSSGCLDSLIQTVSYNPRPTARFQILNNGSGKPMTLVVNNTSQLADSYQWTSVNGQTSNLAEPSFIYPDTGSFPLELIAISAENCADTAVEEVLVLSEFLDAAIIDAQILAGLSKDFRIRLRLKNAGNNQIERLLISILPDGENGLAEELDVELYRGQTVLQLLNTVLINDLQKPAFICFQIEKVNELSDENPLNDRFCLSAFPEQLYLKAYPNPFNERLQIDFVLLENSKIDISLIDASGKEALSIVEDQVYNSGFNSLMVSTESLKGGAYFLSFKVNGNNNDVKLIKQ